jgi:hypothetical protein
MLCTPLLLDTHAMAPPVGAKSGRSGTVSPSWCRSTPLAGLRRDADDGNGRQRQDEARHGLHDVGMLAHLRSPVCRASYGEAHAVKFPAMRILDRAITAVVVVLAAWTTVSAQRAIDLDAATIADVNAAFAKGTLTSERLTQMFLARIDAYDRKGPALRAVLTINPKRSKPRARWTRSARARARARRCTAFRSC